MTDTLISFDTAQLAKLKGFDEPCDWRYDELGNLTATKIGMYEHPNRYVNSYAASTQSLLQKWLREKHNLHMWIHCFKTEWYFSIGTITNTTGVFYYFNGYDLRETYEAALEEGLKTSLNRITLE